MFIALGHSTRTTAPKRVTSVVFWNTFVELKLSSNWVRIHNSVGFTSGTLKVLNKLTMQQNMTILASIFETEENSDLSSIRKRKTNKNTLH